MPLQPPPHLVRLAHEIDVLEDRSGFPGPVIAHGAVYAGEQDHDLVKLSWGTLEAEWRQPADGFEFWGSFREWTLLHSFQAARTRAIRSDGTVAWTLDDIGDVGWDLWGDRLYCAGSGVGMILADPSTGQILGPTPLVLRSSEVPSRLCGDVMLLQARDGDPFRAYDLNRGRFLWEQNLLADIKRTYGVTDSVPLPVIASGGPDLFVCRRGKGIFGFSLNDGKLLWGVEIVIRAMSIHQERVYVWGTTADARVDRLLCLEAATGAVIYEAAHEARFLRAVGAHANEHVAYTDRSGFVGLFRQRDGALAWSHRHHQPISDSPVVAGNRLFVPDEDGKLLVFEGDL